VAQAVRTTSDPPPAVGRQLLIALVTGSAARQRLLAEGVPRAVVKPLFMRPGMHRYLPAIAASWADA
jgi:hypothetical protein